MSDISALQARLSQEWSRNSQLRGYLSELGSGISSAHREMSNYEDELKQILNESKNRIRSSHENIIRAYEIQREIDNLYICFKNMESANKKIRTCNNRKYYEFANYTAVRKIVQGMLDNLNVHMISDAVIYKAIEKEHLKTPDYWLTCVLLSIMAWKNDDRALAERATEISVKLDKKNSAVFYMLFNIRMGREDAALKWFMLYQECELKGSDQRTFLMLFTLLSKTLKETVEDKIKYEIMDFINRVIAMNERVEGFEEQTVLDTIENYLGRMKTDSKLETKLLNRCLLDYADMTDIIMCAQNNINILQFILDIANVSEVEKNTYLEKFINEEIAKPNDVEISVYNEIEYNELIIACNGDLKKAQEKYEALSQKRKKELNLISEMIDWIYHHNSDEVNKEIRKNMFTLTEKLHRNAIIQYVKNYRQRRKDIHPAAIGDYSTQINFCNRTGESQKIEMYYNQERDAKLNQVKYTVSMVGAALCVLGIGLTIYLGNPICLYAVLIGLVSAIYNIISNSMQKKQIFESCRLNIKSKNEMMDVLFAEYEVYKKTLSEYDSYYDKIITALDSI